MEGRVVISTRPKRTLAERKMKKKLYSASERSLNNQSSSVNRICYFWMDEMVFFRMRTCRFQSRIQKCDHVTLF